MKWTEICTRTGMQETVFAKLRACEETFDRTAYAEDIEALSDPERAEETYRVLAERLAPDEENLKIELCELYAAELTWDRYRELGIPEEIFWNTVDSHANAVRETKLYRGDYVIDRAWWMWRQVSMTIFQLGALEYELCRRDGSIHIHIPGKTDLSPASVDASLRQIRPFCGKFFPAFAEAEIRCDSWLLSDVLPELLPETSNIIRFQRRFRLVSSEHTSTWFIRFLFQMLPDTPYAELREDTSLQRKVKAMLLEGKSIGTGNGILREIPG